MVPLCKYQCPDLLTDPAPFSRLSIAALPQGPAPQPFARPAALDPSPLLQVQERVGVLMGFTGRGSYSLRFISRAYGSLPVAIQLVQHVL